MKRIGVRTVAVVGIVAAMAVVGFAATRFYFKYTYSPQRWPTEAFSAEKWKELPQHERYRLCNDLLATGLLRDAPRSKVVELLGTPDWESPELMDYIVKDPKSQEPRVAALYYLEAELSEQGTVRRAFIRSD